MGSFKVLSGVLRAGTDRHVPIGNDAWHDHRNVIDGVIGRRQVDAVRVFIPVNDQGVHDLALVGQAFGPARGLLRPTKTWHQQGDQ